MVDDYLEDDRMDQPSPLPPETADSLANAVVLRLQPGDILVLGHRQMPSREHRDRIDAWFRRRVDYLGGVMHVEDVNQIRVLRPAKP